MSAHFGANRSCPGTPPSAAGDQHSTTISDAAEESKGAGARGAKLGMHAVAVGPEGGDGVTYTFLVLQHLVLNEYSHNFNPAAWLPRLVAPAAGETESLLDCAHRLAWRVAVLPVDPLLDAYDWLVKQYLL